MESPPTLTASQLTERLIAISGSPFRARITGFPACGKTTLARLLATQMPALQHIESESWIYPLEYRKQHDLSGAHPDAYNIAEAAKCLSEYMNGGSISLPFYDHSIGVHQPGPVLHFSKEFPVLLDGTLFSLEQFDRFVPICFFLRPLDLDDWLTVSVKRDVETRFFNQAEAIRHNMRKTRDLDLVLQRSPNAIIVGCTLAPTGYAYTLPI